MNFCTNRAKKSFLIFVVISMVLVLSSSCGDGSDGKNFKIPGVEGPYIQMIKDTILITAVIEKLHIDGGARFSIPNYPNSYIELSPDLQSNGTLFAVSISLKDLLKVDLDTLDPHYLPGGRPLPGVVSGSLPAVAMSIPKFSNISFYMGPKVFGIFIPIKMDIGANILSFRHYVEGKRVGNLSLVGPEADKDNSGLLLMLDLTQKKRRQLEKIANSY